MILWHCYSFRHILWHGFIQMSPATLNKNKLTIENITVYVTRVRFIHFEGLINGLSHFKFLLILCLESNRLFWFMKYHFNSKFLLGKPGWFENTVMVRCQILLWCLKCTFLVLTDSDSFPDVKIIITRPMTYGYYRYDNHYCNDWSRFTQLIIISDEYIL